MAKKLTAKKIKLSDQEVGFEFAEKSVFLKFSERSFEAPDEDTGEIVTKKIPLFLFASQKDPNDRLLVTGDKGLIQALEEAGINEGDEVDHIVKLEQVKLSGNRKMNQYDVFGM